MLLVAIAVAGSIYRATVIGLLPIMFFHIALSVSFISLYVLRRKLSPDFKGAFIVIAFFLAGSAGLYNFGLSGAGTMLLGGAAIIASLVHRTRFAFLICGLGAAVQIIVFIGVNHLGWTFKAELSEYLYSHQAWVNNLVAYCYITLSIIFIVDKFFNYLKTMSAVLQDAVEEKSSQLEQSEVLLSTVMNSMPFGVFWKDTQLRFLGGNQRFINDVGVKNLSEIVGKTDREIMEDTERAHKFEFLDRDVLDTGEPIIGFVDSHIDESGRLTFTSANKVLMRDKRGEKAGLVTTYIDVTDSKNMEIALRESKAIAEQASTAKSEFLATMSHEIRTPINGIMGLLELTLETELNDKQREYVTKAELSAHTLLHIVNDILDISKIEAGKMEIEQIPFCVSDTLVQLQNQVAHLAEGKGLKFIVESRGCTEQSLLGDPTKLLQVLVNLCSNAVKFTQEGEVRVNAAALKTPKNVKLRVTVSDTGIGIDESKQTHLFEAFSQEDSSTSRRFGGTGLGLAIVKQLLELQGGNIELNSEIGKGSTFIFNISYELADVAVKQETISRKKHLNGISILLAEDNEINQMIALEMLQQSGAKVTVVDDGQKALEKLSEVSFDIVLMDIQMPNLDGVEALLRIREQEEFDELPVIALTANVMAHEVKYYKEIGFSAHLGKPFQKEQLVHAIHQALAMDTGSVL